MRRISGVIAALMFSAVPLGADDFQLRTLFHRPPRDAFDIAAWAIAPDLTAAPLKGLGLVGVGTRAKRGWAELMVGSFVADGEKFQLAVNFRSSLRFDDFTVYLEGMYRDPSGKPTTHHRWVAVEYINFRVTDRLSVGIESDSFFEPDRKPVVGWGPRLPVKVSGRLTVTPAFQFCGDCTGGNFFRIYAVTTFSQERK